MQDNNRITITIEEHYKNSLSTSTGFQIINFNNQQFSIALTSMLFDVFNLEDKRIDVSSNLTFKIKNVILHKHCTGTAATRNM